MENNTKRSVKKYVFLVLVLLLVAALTALPFALDKMNAEKGDGSSILSATVTRADISSTVSGTGTLEAKDAVKLTVPEGVVLTGYTVKDGDMVHKGDKVASVDRVSVYKTAAELGDALATVKESGAFDYIFLDCPPSLGLVMTSSLVAADSVLIPTQAEFLAMDGLALITGSIDRIRASINPDIELNGILFTMVNLQTRLTQDVMEEVKRHFGDKIYETYIPRNVRVSEAPSMGTPVVFLDPRSKGAEAYKAFAWEFMSKNKTRTHVVPAKDDATPAPAPTAEAEPAEADADEAAASETEGK